MSYTQVQICNLALTRMGAAGIIQSMTEASEEAYNCNRLYEPSVRAMLDAYPWDFAREIATLALLSETPDDYDYAYSLPSGCVRPLYLLPKQDPPLEFRCRGTTLYTDQEDAVLAYTDYVSNPALYSDTFAEAVSYRLAADLAVPLASDLQLQERMLKLAQVAVATARAADGKRGKNTSLKYSDITAARA